MSMNINTTALHAAFLLAATVVVSGCAGTQIQTASNDATAVATVAGTVVASTASKPTLAELQGPCAKFTATASAVKTDTGGGAKTTVGYVAAPGQAFCGIVAQGQVPANADANTQHWLSVLSDTISTVKALAPLAEVALTLAGDRQPIGCHLAAMPVAFR